MKAILQCSIRVERIQAFAEMAWLAERPELELVCRAAATRSNLIDPPLLQEILPGLGEAGAANVKAWCEMLRICDPHGDLTPLGKDVAAGAGVPIPEQGVYEMWLASHPLLGERLLHVERMHSGKFSRTGQIDELPIYPRQNVPFQSVKNINERYVVRDFPSNHGNGGCCRLPSSSCLLRWTVDFSTGSNQWQLEGELEAPNGGGRSGRVPIIHSPEYASLDVWGLIRHWGEGPLRQHGQWGADQRWLGVSPDELGDGERDSFQKRNPIELKDVNVPGKGTFDTAVLEQVPIGPRDGGGAQKWAMSRFFAALNKDPAYRSRTEARRLFEELTRGTPLGGYQPTLPAHDDLIRDRRLFDNRGRFWSLAAPVDLCPAPVPQEVLAAFITGTAQTTVAVETSKESSFVWQGGAR